MFLDTFQGGFKPLNTYSQDFEDSLNASMSHYVPPETTSAMKKGPNWTPKHLLRLGFYGFQAPTEQVFGWYRMYRVKRSSEYWRIMNTHCHIKRERETSLRDMVIHLQLCSLTALFHLFQYNVHFPIFIGYRPCSSISTQKLRVQRLRL